MESIAKAKFLRGSPQKARLVIDLIRGKNVANALAILQFTNKRATDNIEKCLRSAIANATFKAEQQNIAIDPDDLWVKACFVDMGPHKHRRRVRPAPQGRAYREQRYYCHVTIELSSEKPENSKEKGARTVKKAKSAEGGVKKQRKAAAETKPVDATPVAPATVEEQPVEPTSAPNVAPAADAVEEIAGATTPVETTATQAEKDAGEAPATETGTETEK